MIVPLAYIRFVAHRSPEISTILTRSAMAHNSVSSGKSRQRRKHQKSRNGCLQCKQKHYKVCHRPNMVPATPPIPSMLLLELLHTSVSLNGQCDEVHPVCTNCRRLELSCSLGAPSPSSDLTHLPEKQLNIDDLRLLHDWCKGNDIKFSDHEGNGCDERMSEIDIGFQHPYVLHIILALAALHLCATGVEKAKWYALAISHHISAINFARPHIAAPSGSHRQAVFMFSNFNALFAFVEPSLRTQGDEDASRQDYLGGLFNSFQMARGIAMVISANKDCLEDKGLTNNPAWHYDTDSILPTLETRFVQYSHLQDLVSTHCAGHQRVAAHEAVKDLFVAMAVLEDTPKHHSSASLIQRWPIHLDKVFLDMCETRHPVALVVLGHFAVLLNLRTNIWFFARWPRILITAVSDALLDTPMQKYLEQPLSQLNIVEAP